MKNVFFALAALIVSFSTNAFATEAMELPQGSAGIALIQGELLAVTTNIPKCPAGAMCEPVSLAHVKFTLPSCVDTLGPVTAQSDWIAGAGKLNLTVTAYAILNERSATVRCVKPQTATVIIPLGLGFISKDQVNIFFTTSFLTGR